MSPSPSTLAAFARLCLLEAERGVWDSFVGKYEPPKDPEHLLALAEAADRLTYLHRRGATLEQARELLTARGMPELAQYLCRVLLPNVHPDRREALLGEKALLLFAGTIPGAMAFREKSPEQVGAALRSVLEVCQRGRAEALRAWATRGRGGPAATTLCEVCGMTWCDGCPMASRSEKRD